MSGETLKLAEELKKTHRLAPAEVHQQSAKLRNDYFLLENLSGEQKIKKAQEIKDLEDLLRDVITSYGGISNIDTWLVEHDPENQKLKNIQGMNWDFLK